MFLKMWITRLWILLAILVIVTGVAIWAVFFKPSQQVTKEVTKVVEVTRVVEKTVVVQATPVPATPTPTKVVTPMPDRVDKLSTVVAQLSAQLAGGSVQAQAVQPITASASSLVTTTGAVTGTTSITPTVVITQGMWTITYYSGATPEMRGWKFQDPNPKSWSIFPNVTNTVASKVYPASWLLEYGVDKDSVCSGVGCFFVVPAGEYRLYSGDYSIPGIDEWQAHDDTGSAVMFVNVGNVTAEWEALLKRGFTYRGRYWWGEHLPEAVWAGMSHAAYRMLNLSGETANAGANCSNRDGCPRVRLTFVIVSGHEILMKATAFVSR